VCAQAYEFFRSSAGCVAHGEKIRQFFRTDPTPTVLERRVPPEKIKIRQIYRSCGVASFLRGKSANSAVPARRVH
jgi:hypothetical protein